MYIAKKYKLFFETKHLNISIIHFKMNLYMLIKRYPRWKKLSLSAYYFENNFKMIKIVCKKNEHEWRLEEYK